LFEKEECCHSSKKRIATDKKTTISIHMFELPLLIRSYIIVYAINYTYSGGEKKKSNEKAYLAA
jgi:hypothetical protein